MPPKTRAATTCNTANEAESGDDTEVEPVVVEAVPKKTAKKSTKAAVKRTAARTTPKTVVHYVTMPTTTSSASRSLKLPPFSSRDIDFWFIQVEAQFRTGNVTDDQTKFDYVIAALDPDISADIQDVLESPPDDNKYGFLKLKLRKRLSASEQKKIDLLLDEPQLGDRTPSQFLRFLRKEGRLTDDRILKSIWSKALPANVRLALAGRGHDLDDLAEIADEIVDTHDVISSVGRQEKRRQDVPTTSVKKSLDDVVADLVTSMAQLSRDVASRRRQTSRERPTTAATRTPATTAEQATLCFYHATFGDNAKKCKVGCPYKVQGNGSGQQ